MLKFITTMPKNRLLIRQVTASAFIDNDQIVEVFRNFIAPLFSRGHEFRPLIKWFAINYITGDNRIGSAPRFPPIVWSVYENDEFGFPRTSN